LKQAIKREPAMRPILTVEFSASTGESEIREESVPIHNPEEFFAFVSPGGGCDRIPDEVSEIRIVFLPLEHHNTRNPLSDRPVTLQIGMVIFNGPLSEVIQTAEQILDKAGRGELSESFLKVIS